MTATLKDRAEDRLNTGLLGQWYVIAKSSQVQPGRPFAVKALGMKLVLWRNAAGQIQCIEDYCPHRGAPLSRGTVRGDLLSCAYHGVQLDGTGTVAKVPALPGCLLEGRKELKSFVVEEHRDGVFAWFPSADQQDPLPLILPYEMVGDAYAMFLTTGLWETNYRYALENIADPMHGPYLHAISFTLSEGSLEDTVKLTSVEHGFNVARVAQQGANFDWAELILDNGAPHCRVNIPYPAAGGPGGIMRVVNFITPVDDVNSRIFFWRCREITGLEREVWRFLFRTTFEPRHWDVLEQDREMLAAMPDNARHRERLYQHDIGITRLRQLMSKKAKAQIQAEDALKDNRPVSATA
jgi:phenylpropionate dioxygenase-like ring-hydroxylating dioxygenase large terminal subunit